MSTVSTVPTLTLNDGNEIPQLGFGVFQIPPADTAEAVRTALDVGYRHIDTAEMYRNEAGVGEAIRASGLSRDEVFITSKLSNACHHPDDARKAFEHTLTALGSDYVDLFLVHWPLPTLYDGDYVSTWKVMEEFKARAGRARSASPTSRSPTSSDWRPRPTSPPPSTRSSSTRICSTTRSVATGRTTASTPRPGLRSLRAACSTTL